jgi:hypothetical protein
MGVPVDVTSYDLTVDGAPGGRVQLREGRVIRESKGRERVEVGLEIDNRTGDRSFRMPCDQIWIGNLGPQSAKLIQLDGSTVPGMIEVPAGATEMHTLTFMPTEPVRLSSVRGAEVHWTLLIDGATEPVARSTAFIAVRDASALNRELADTRNWDPPSKPVTDGTWFTNRPNAPNHTIGHNLTRAQQLPTEQP